MAGNLRLRVHQLRRMASDLGCWRVRASRAVDGWTCDGERLEPGRAWAWEPRIHHLRCPSIEVPESWPVEECRLEVRQGGQGHLSLRSLCGKSALYPVGERHSVFRLPGRFSEAEARIAPVTGGSGHLTTGTSWGARVVWHDEDVTALCRLVLLVCHAADTPEVGSLRSDLVDLTEQALASVRWPSASGGYVARVERLEQLNRLWSTEDAAGRATALDTEQRASVAAALDFLSGSLAKLSSGQSPTRGRVGLLGYAHTDLAWFWPEDVTHTSVEGQAGGAVELLERYPDYRFGQSAGGVYAELERRRPELFAKVRNLVAAGRWEPLGGMWTEPDLNLPNGESLARQLLYGQAFFESRFGRRCTVCWLPDTFGFSGNLPQLLRGACVDYLYTTKLCLQDTNEFPLTLFWWEGMDGTRVLAYSSNTSSGYQGTPRPDTVTETWQSLRQPEFFPEALQLLGHDGAMGPSESEVATAELLRLLPAIPETRFVFAETFFAEASCTTADLPLPVWPGELYLEAHRGTYTSQGRTKVSHRRAEWALLAVEAAESLSGCLSGDVPPSRSVDWCTVLDQQSHDILTGVSVGEVQAVARAKLDAVANEAERGIDEVTERLAGAVVPAGAARGLAVLNPTFSRRRMRFVLPATMDVGQVAADGTRVYATERDVEPMGIAWSAAEESPGVSVDDLTMENSLVRVRVLEDGTVGSLWHKGLRRELLAGPGNRLETFVDRPHFWDAWELSPTYERFRIEGLRCTSVSVSEPGPHRAVIRVVHSFRDSTICQDLRLWANSARLEFATSIDWHERRVLLRTYFPVAVDSDHATYEVPYGAVRRPINVASAMAEARFEVPAQRFACLSDGGCGVALLNNGRYGHRVRGREMSLSLLRSPVFPDPSCDEGEHAFVYAVFPYVGGWFEGGVLAEAEDVNSPSRPVACAVDGAGHRSVFATEGLPVALGAFKPAEDGSGYALRVYEPAGKRGAVRVHSPDGWRIDAELNLLEDVIGPPMFDFGPHQIRTWRVRPA